MYVALGGTMYVALGRTCCTRGTRMLHMYVALGGHVCCIRGTMYGDMYVALRGPCMLH